MSSLSMLSSTDEFSNLEKRQTPSLQTCTSWLKREYGQMKEEILRDRIVVGIRDTRLSEKLQLEKDLMVDKAVTLVRAQEQVRQQ